MRLGTVAIMNKAWLCDYVQLFRHRWEVICAGTLDVCVISGYFIWIWPGNIDFLTSLFIKDDDTRAEVETIFPLGVLTSDAIRFCKLPIFHILRWYT